MNPRCYLYAFFGVLGLTAASCLAAVEDLREWTDTTGVFQVEARFVHYDDGEVVLRRFDGKTITVALSRLSKPDREYVRARMRRKNSSGGTGTSEPGTTPDIPVPTPAERGTGSGPPNPNCPLCRGSGLAPRTVLPAYVHIEGRRLPEASLSLPHRFCPHCQDGKDGRLLLDVEEERLANIGRRNAEWEKRLQMRLMRFENHLLVIHSQVNPEDARRVAVALEILTKHLQELTGSLLLTPRQPATDELILLANEKSYLRFIDILEETVHDRRYEWHAMRKRVASSVGKISFLRVPPHTPIENVALFATGYQQIHAATAARQTGWLGEGFAAYCEHAITGLNLMHGIVAQSGDVSLTRNWDAQFRRLAMLGQTRSWDEMFDLELAEFKAIHHLQSKAMVTFLLREPGDFLDLVELFAMGTDDREALAEAYGKPVAELEHEWQRWLGIE